MEEFEKYVKFWAVFLKEVRILINRDTNMVFYMCSPGSWDSFEEQPWNEIINPQAMSRRFPTLKFFTGTCNYLYEKYGHLQWEYILQKKEILDR